MARRTYPHRAPRKRPQKAIPDATRVAARRRRGTLARPALVAPPQKRHMSQSADKPYTRYRAARVRRPRTDAPPEPPVDAPAPRQAVPTDGAIARASGRPARAGGGAAASAGGGAGAARAAARAQAEPASIYRADRRAERRSQRPDLSLVPRAERRRRLFRWWYLLAIPLVLAVAVGVWAFLGYRAFDKAVRIANHRITRETRAALVDPKGGVLSTPTTLLVLGSDKRGKEPARSDTILLMRFDPKTHTVSQLSIPRDTLVNVPGHGLTKINEADFWGGPALAVKVIGRYTGIPINHVMQVNFHGFPDLIDSVGGVVVDVPHDITSWYTGNTTVHFKKGPQLMNGKQALIYSRIRHVDNDFMRMGRQQQVVQALEAKITRPRNILHLPWTGAEFLKGVGTDLSTRQIMELAYLDWRAKGARQHKTVLMGTPEWIGGGSYVVVDPTVLHRTVRQFLNR